MINFLFICLFYINLFKSIILKRYYQIFYILCHILKYRD